MRVGRKTWSNGTVKGRRVDAIKIIVDTREQRPLRFPKHEYLEGTTKRKLNVGDYAVEFNDGVIPPVRFERKDISDLFGTLSQGYKRFKREIARAEEADLLLVIIIEGGLADILKGHKYSTRKGKSILKQLFTIMVNHHVPFVALPTRAECSKFILGTFIALGEKHARDKSKQE